MPTTNRPKEKNKREHFNVIYSKHMLVKTPLDHVEFDILLVAGIRITLVLIRHNKICKPMEVILDLIQFMDVMRSH